MVRIVGVRSAWSTAASSGEETVLGRIQNLHRRTTAAQREAHQSPVFATQWGSATTGILRWGDEVDVLEHGTHRTKVRASGGSEGWVAKGDVVELRWVRKSGQRFTAPLFRNATGSAKLIDLLWGDPVLVLSRGESRWRVRARNWTGYLGTSNLVTTPLLELYFIDVGQGDGVLIRTPDGRHLLVDGGYTRSKQPTGKSAADFVDWKFFKDYGLARIHLDAMIASHCDADHYGGLWDILRSDEDAMAELDCAAADIDGFYHAGVSWWRPGNRWLGRTKDGYLIDLLDDIDSLDEGLRPGADRRLQGEWADFLREVRDATRNVRRLATTAGEVAAVHLPGFDGGSDGVGIRVLAPVVHDVNGVPGVQNLGSNPQNTNGHSVLLRVDYGHARILVTGDLNRNSMRALLREYVNREDALACDVAKGCHHGSDDVSYEFLSHVEAAATIISSGDTAGHGHPRPTAVAASAVTGHLSIDPATDTLLTPLVYSTEVERSVAIGRCTWMEVEDYPHDGALMPLRLYARGIGSLPVEWRDDATAKRDTKSSLHYEETRSGAINPSRKSRRFAGSYLVSGIVYGLVNVRTDGETILCATMDELNRGWKLQSFPARF